MPQRSLCRHQIAALGGAEALQEHRHHEVPAQPGWMSHFQPGMSGQGKFGGPHML